MNPFPAKETQIKISARSPSEDKAFCPVEEYFVEKTETSDIFRCLIKLTYTAFKDVRFVELPVMTAYELQIVIVWQRCSVRMT